MGGGLRAPRLLVFTELSPVEVLEMLARLRAAQAGRRGAVCTRERRWSGAASARNYAPRPARTGTRRRAADFPVPLRVKKKYKN